MEIAIIDEYHAYTEAIKPVSDKEFEDLAMEGFYVLTSDNKKYDNDVFLARNAQHLASKPITDDILRAEFFRHKSEALRVARHCMCTSVPVRLTDVTLRKVMDV